MKIRFCDLDTMIVFANNSKGELVFVDDVENGYACNCFCINCHGKLNAKNNGDQKAHHFAHASGSDCKKGHENTIPYFVQRILNQTKWMLLPRGSVKLNGDYVNDYQTISISKTELKKIEGYPPVLLITTTKGKQIALYVVFTDDYYDREIVYKQDFNNLIELDIRNYRGKPDEVQPTLESLLTHRRRELKWIKRYDEIELIAKIKDIAVRKSFGSNTSYHEFFYCPQEKKVVSDYERSCNDCPYLLKNVLDGYCERKCLGFIENLSPQSIMNSKKPDYSNIEGPSFLELNSIRERGYYWLHLNDLPKAYPDIDSTLVFNREANRVFLVSLKAILNGQLKGLEVDPDGNVDYNPKILYFFSRERCWRICSLANYKIKQEDFDYLMKHI